MDCIFNEEYPVNINKFKYILLIPAIAALVNGCSGDGGGAPQNQAGDLIPAVEAVKSRYGALPLTERVSGVVKARNQVSIYPEINVPIVEVYVRDGDYVNEGDPLVRLRDKELRERMMQARAAYRIAVAQARQAEAQLDEMQAELKRTRTLAGKGLASDAELETIQTRAVSAEADLELARARIEQARANLKERKEALSRAVVRAPVSGVVGSRNAEVGMLVNSNTSLFTLGQLDRVEVDIVLTDRMLNYIQEGQRVEVLPGKEESSSINGVISRISPFLHRVSHSTEAEIDLPNPEGRLKPGMFVAVDIHYGESENATLVPLAALYENPASGVTGVYVSRDSLISGSTDDPDRPDSTSLTEPVMFEFVPVEVIARGRMEAGVGGIDPGVWVITLGQDLLGGDSGQARVRRVEYKWVYRLQHLQRQDLLEELMNQSKPSADSSSFETTSSVSR